MSRSASSGSTARYTPVPNCISFSTAQTCGQASRCELQAGVIKGFWGVTPGACTTAAAPAAAAIPGGATPPAPPQVTPALVQTAFRQIGLPSLRVHVQPTDKTLVNFPTIFYTDPPTVIKDLNLLGQQVHVVATPQAYTWHHGDGTSATTTSPGGPYPALDVTYEYTHAHTTVQTSVEVTYTGRFQVAGGTWQDIPGTVTVAGPSAPLRISEATPMLAGADR